MNAARAVATLALLLGGCATTPVAPSKATPVPIDRLLAFQEKTPERTVTLVVTRDAGYLPGEILLRNGVDLMGRGLCGFQPEKNWTQRETIIRPGETKRFRLTFDPSGRMDIQRADHAEE